MTRFIFIVALFALVLNSCQSDRRRYKFAGVWDIDQVDASYFTNGELDSNTVTTDLGYWLLEDNASDIGNRFRYIYEKPAPQGHRSFMTAAGLQDTDDECLWYVEGSNKDRFTMRKADPYADAWTVYNILKASKRKLVLQFIIADGNLAGHLKYKEVITLKRN
ncbi:MAG: hypothetical protein EP338_10180 [Bacteroidetes bacterium]|nr:MAG: hypothetical protein EP338_10180 [Bacteroidota bacterium]